MDDLETLSYMIYNSGTYFPHSNNCATFAENVWNSIAPNNMQVDAGFVAQPVTLYNSIKSKSGYQVNKSIMNTIPIGRVSNGNFTTITLNCNYSRGVSGIDHSIAYNYTPEALEVT